MFCKAGSLNIQLYVKLRHPDLLHFHHPFEPSCKRKSPSQLHRQEHRYHAAKTNVEEAKLSAEYNNPSKEVEKPKESFLENENPQYSSDISSMINTEKQFHLLTFDHCDFVNVEILVRHHMSITHKPFQCEY